MLSQLIQSLSVLIDFTFPLVDLSHVQVKHCPGRASDWLLAAFKAVALRAPLANGVDNMRLCMLHYNGAIEALQKIRRNPYGTYCSKYMSHNQWLHGIFNYLHLCDWVSILNPVLLLAPITYNSGQEALSDAIDVIIAMGICRRPSLVVSIWPHPDSYPICSNFFPQKGNTEWNEQSNNVARLTISSQCWTMTLLLIPQIWNQDFMTQVMQ